jgi:hypothetical protein
MCMMIREAEYRVTLVESSKCEVPPRRARGVQLSPANAIIFTSDRSTVGTRASALCKNEYKP